MNAFASADPFINFVRATCFSGSTALSNSFFETGAVVNKGSFTTFGALGFGRGAGATTSLTNLLTAFSCFTTAGAEEGVDDPNFSSSIRIWCFAIFETGAIADLRCSFNIFLNSLTFISAVDIFIEDTRLFFPELQPIRQPSDSVSS